MSKETPIGKCTVCYENGQKSAEGGYVNGERDGLWTYWDEEGNVTSIKTYEAGDLVSEKITKDDDFAEYCSGINPAEVPR